MDAFLTPFDWLMAFVNLVVACLCFWTWCKAREYHAIGYAVMTGLTAIMYVLFAVLDVSLEVRHAASQGVLYGLLVVISYYRIHFYLRERRKKNHAS